MLHSYHCRVCVLLLFSHPVICDSLQPRGLQHARPPFPPSSTEVCPSSCLLHWGCHTAISSLMLYSSSWITALLRRRGFCNSRKLWARLCRATQDGWVIAENSDKTWSSWGGNGKPPQYTCHENLINGLKGQKDMPPKDESPRSGRVCMCVREIK